MYIYNMSHIQYISNGQYIFIDLDLNLLLVEIAADHPAHFRLVGGKRGARRGWVFYVFLSSKN